MNLKTALPVLVSWDGGFTLGWVSDVKPRHLKLELRRHPESGRETRWAVWGWLLTGGPAVQSNFLLFLGLPARTETAARMMFSEIQAGAEYKRSFAPGQLLPEMGPALLESQLRFLTKQYPRTVGFFRAPAAGLATVDQECQRMELCQAYVEETFACSKVMLEPPKDSEQLLRMAGLFKKMSARKQKADPVEYELIAGCANKGYSRMTLAQLQAAFGEVVGHKMTIEAIRQKWKRLGLPSDRQRGRPKAISMNAARKLRGFVRIRKAESGAHLGHD